MFSPILRTTIPLVSYIRTSLRFWYYASVSARCQNLENKIGVTSKIWEKAGLKLLMDLTENSVNFSTFATSNIRLLLFFFFGEEDQWTKLVRLVRKNHDHRRKTRENNNFLTKQPPFLSPRFFRGSTVIVIHHNVELCKQYFLHECLLLIRKSCNWFSVIAFMEKDHCEN